MFWYKFWREFRKQTYSRMFVVLVGAFLVVSCGLNSAKSTTTQTESLDLDESATTQPLVITPPNGELADVSSDSSPTPDIIQAGDVPVSTASQTPMPTELPLPAPRPLTNGGCCVQPFWSPDSQQVRFIDRPAQDQQAGQWRVGIEDGAVTLVTDRLGIYSPDFSLRAYLVGGDTVVERLADEERWVIPNGGRAVSFSPDNQWLAWVAGDAGPPFDTAQREIWVSRVDGSQVRMVKTLTGGGLSGWFPDGRLLVNGRLGGDQPEQALWSLSVPEDPSLSGELIELVRAERLRSAQLSPDGRWLVYAITFSGDPELDGIWLLDTVSQEQRRLEFFGAYRWRDPGRLIFVPLDLDQVAHTFWQMDVSTGFVQPLTSSENEPVKIAGGDWSVSPDGKKVVFVSAFDQNLWLLELH